MWGSLGTSFQPGSQPALQLLPLPGHHRGLGPRAAACTFSLFVQIQFTVALRRVHVASLPCTDWNWRWAPPRCGWVASGLGQASCRGTAWWGGLLGATALQGGCRGVGLGFSSLAVTGDQCRLSPPPPDNPRAGAALPSQVSRAHRFWGVWRSPGGARELTELGCFRGPAGWGPSGKEAGVGWWGVHERLSPPSGFPTHSRASCKGPGKPALGQAGCLCGIPPAPHQEWTSPLLLAKTPCKPAFLQVCIWWRQATLSSRLPPGGPGLLNSPRQAPAQPKPTGVLPSPGCTASLPGGPPATWPQSPVPATPLPCSADLPIFGKSHPRCSGRSGLCCAHGTGR